MADQPTPPSQPWHAHISDEEWEGLCDGCGVCCMHKYEDEDTGAIMITSIACGLFDTGLCQCQNYKQRFEKVPTCMDLREIPAKHMQWLPVTCAYRLTYEEKPLPDWHYLNSGSRETVHEVGISMRGACTPETEVLEEEWCAYVHDIQEPVAEALEGKPAQNPHKTDSPPSDDDA